MSTHAPGVLPDHVSRDERASSWLIFCDLTVDSPASATLLPAWLQTVTTAVQTLTAGSSDGTDDADGEGSVGDIQPVATCTTAFGRTLIEKAGRSSVLPTGLLQLPAIGDGTLENHDVLFYVLSTSDAAVAQFLRELQVSLAGAGVGGRSGSNAAISGPTSTRRSASVTGFATSRRLTGRWWRSWGRTSRPSRPGP